MKPYHDRIQVLPDPDETTVSGIHLMGKEVEKNRRGTVIAVGPGAPLTNLKVTLEAATPEVAVALVKALQDPIPVPCKPGDRVLFGAYSGTKIKLDGIEYLMIRASDLMGEV